MCTESDSNVAKKKKVFTYDGEPAYAQILSGEERGNSSASKCGCKTRNGYWRTGWWQ
jgi:hypothetical protein